MANPLVSVVMSVRDGARFLPEAVDSILGQSLARLEFIIVDDGSSDETPLLLTRWREEDARVRTFRCELGLAGALNLGCQAAKGNYIAIMDSDDIAFPDRLERQVGFLQDHPGIALAGGGIVFIDEKGTPCGERGYPTDDSDLRATLEHAPAFCHPTLVMRREAFLKVGGYRRAFALAVDYDFVLRFIEHFAMANLPDPVLYKRIHLGQVTVRRRTQQVLSSLAARMSARSRRETGYDPVDDVDAISARLLIECGLDENTLNRQLVGSLIWAANGMLHVSQPEKALEFLEETDTLIHRASVGRKLAGDFHWALARVRLQQGEVLGGVPPSLKAMILNPKLPAGALLDWLRRHRDPIRSRG